MTEVDSRVQLLAEVALVGLGSADPDQFSLVMRDKYVTEQELLSVRGCGAVGGVCAYYFNVDGQVLDVELNRRVVSLDIGSFKKIKEVLLVAGVFARPLPSSVQRVEASSVSW